MSNSPSLLLSIIIPVYNYGHFLPDAIESLVNQDFDLSNSELILVDDGSTDHTPEVIERYAKRYPFIRAIRFPKNQGVHYATNYPIDFAKGEYFHFMAADDFRGKNFFKRSMELLLKHPSIPICCSDPGWASEKTGRSHLVSNSLISGVSEPTVFNSKQLVKLLRDTQFWVPGHTTILKREVLFN